MRLDSPQRRGALPQIAPKNPTRTSLKARVKSYLFHLYWNEAGPFNETDVAVISSDRTTRGNDASLLCYLSSERVPGLCELSLVLLFLREPVLNCFWNRLLSRWMSVWTIFLFLNEAALALSCHLCVAQIARIDLKHAVPRDSLTFSILAPLN